MTDIHTEYKEALHRARARDPVEREEEKRIKRGKPAYTEEEYSERLRYFLIRIPYKLHKMRYSSFTRYFGHLKCLGWVEETGRTEPTAIQDDYPPAPSLVFYRLTEAGLELASNLGRGVPEELEKGVYLSRAEVALKRWHCCSGHAVQYGVLCLGIAEHR